MSLTVKGHHPVAEKIARQLIGIEGVPRDGMRRMVNSCAMETVKVHEDIVADLKKEHAMMYEALEDVAPWLKSLCDDGFVCNCSRFDKVFKALSEVEQANE